MQVDRETEERWRDALQQKGLAEVLAELDMRPGRPSDVVFDIGDRPPYPTRGFCWQWCVSGGGPSPGFAPHAAVLVALAALFVVCVLHAEVDWPAARAHLPNFASAAPLPLGPPPVSDDGIANTSVISTTVTRTILPSCTWVSASDAIVTVQRLPPCAKLGSKLSASSDHAQG